MHLLLVEDDKLVAEGLCRSLRQQGYSVEHCASIKSAMQWLENDEIEVQGLDLGADDYLAKPFDPAELFARLRVASRRVTHAQSSTINVANVEMDTSAFTVTLDQEPVNLPRKEFMLLKALFENQGRVLSKQQLESKLYEWGEEVGSNTIEVHIHHLRKKLPKDLIKTLRGIGYVVGKR